MCEVCSRIFRRQSDKARHKCMEEGKKPRREQQVQSNVQIVSNGSGGLTVHRCIEF